MDFIFLDKRKDCFVRFELKRRPMTEDQKKNVKFIGNQIRRDEAIDFIDKILKEKGRFDDYADLSGGLDVITDTYKVMITDDDDSYAVQIEPFEGDSGELFFTVYKANGTLYRDVAEIKPKALDDEDIDFLEDL